MNKREGINTDIREKLSTIKKRFLSKKRSNFSCELMGYVDLAPLDNISDENTYIKALDWAIITNSRIKNIALSGPYGSGKSSIIQSYIKAHPQLKTAKVSLAAFRENGSEDKSVGYKDSDAIEEAILKQLFYHVSHKDIPQSRYRKLHRIDRLETMLFFCIITIFVAIISYVFFSDAFTDFINKIAQAGNNLGFSWKITASFAVVGFITLDCFVSGLYRRVLGKIKVKEVKLTTSTTISAEGDRDNSVFNQNLDEIIYYFEEMKYDVVFFEDLDRLKNASIFVRLRDLNILLNNNKALKKTVKFVYAVRDDIFNETDRTKFFEFIIPIVPIINSTNSGEVLTKLINEGNVPTTISPEYIMDVAPFISDMRLLQNAFNEFLTYKKTLQTDQSLNLDDQTMFSLVIFKNLYPKEFADLQSERGIVKQAFTDKIAAIENQRHDLQTKIDREVSQIEGSQNDLLGNRQELVASFLCEITNWEGSAYQVDIQGKNYHFDDFMNERGGFGQIVESLRKVSSVTVGIHYQPFSGHSSSVKYKDIPITLFENYAKRFQYLVPNIEATATTLRKDIEDQKQKQYLIGGYSLKKLIEVFGTENILSESVRGNKPLVYMLRKGYIDERYVDYINYFKGTSITTADMNFILSVKNHEALPYTYELTKTDQIVLRLQPFEFEQEEILNFDLLEFLLSVDLYKDKRARFIKKMIDESEKCWQFLDEFSEKTEYESELFHDISSAWPRMWEYISQNPTLTPEKKNHYLTRMLVNAEMKDIKVQDSGGSLAGYILSDSAILNELSSVPANKLIMVIDALGIDFEDVELARVPETVVDHIIKNRHYNLCMPMIHRVVELLAPELDGYVESKNFTTLLCMNCQAVLDYIDKLPKKYIRDVIFMEKNTDESVEAISMLLQKVISDTEMCVELISRQCFVANDLQAFMFNEIPGADGSIESIWNQILTEDKLLPSWNNVQIYWNRFGLSEYLLQYIERNASRLVHDEFVEIEEEFIREYLTSSGDNHSYGILTRVMRLQNFDVSIADIPEDRTEVLIDNRYFMLTLSIYNQIQSAYPELQVRTILKNQSEFIGFVDKITVNNVLFTKLIYNEKATVELKEALLNVFGVSCMSEDIASELCNNRYKIKKDVFFAAWEYLNENQKKGIMFKYLSLLNSIDFERCFSEIKEYNNLCDRVRHNVDLPDNGKNQVLAKRLKELEYITSWKTENRVHKIQRGKIAHTEQYQVIVCIVKAQRNK